MMSSVIMIKKTLLLFLVFCAGNAFSQPGNKNINDARFCGKHAEGGASVSFTLDELNSCDFKIIPFDSTMKIYEFSISLFTKQGKFSLEGKDVLGDTIPPLIRKMINENVTSVVLESIKAKDSSKRVVKIRPISINII